MGTECKIDDKNKPEGYTWVNKDFISYNGNKKNPPSMLFNFISDEYELGITN